jgi:rhodanese-related sulfurtransferase
MAAGLAAELGYKNLMIYSDGVPGWGKAGHPLNKEKAVSVVQIPPVNPGQLKEMMGMVHILDVRMESVYKAGHIQGSQNIPIYSLSKRHHEVPKDKKIVVVDTLGVQAYVPACWFLKNKGYNDLSFLQGSIGAWTKEGFPVEK